MYPQPWQRWAWTAVPLISLAVLAPVPFAVAWGRRVVGMRTVTIYTTLSTALFAMALADVNIRAGGTLWREVFRYLYWAYLLTSVAHVALLDTNWGKRVRSLWTR